MIYNLLFLILLPITMTQLQAAAPKSSQGEEGADLTDILHASAAMFAPNRPFPTLDSPELEQEL